MLRVLENYQNILLQYWDWIVNSKVLFLLSKAERRQWGCWGRSQIEDKCWEDEVVTEAEGVFKARPLSHPSISTWSPWRLLEVLNASRKCLVPFLMELERGKTCSYFPKQTVARNAEVEAKGKAKSERHQESGGVFNSKQMTKHKPNH